MSSAALLLTDVTRNLPGGGEDRPGQIEMTELVASAVARRETTLIEAGTGTGKSFAYLTPLIAADCRSVVATATIALQGQLVAHDVPRVAESLGREVTVELLKGRGNYLCRQRLDELQRADRTEQLDLLRGRNPGSHLDAIADWAEETVRGDRDELDPAPPTDVWAAVSVGADECPGASRCPAGDRCFAEQARQRAHGADVIVTNHHYYGLHLASGGELLPDHDVVVFDEAHQLPETLGATCGTELSGNRLRSLARRARSILTDDDTASHLDRVGLDLDDQLRARRNSPNIVDADMVATLVAMRDRAERLISTLRKLNPAQGTDAAARVERTTVTATALIDDIDAVIGADDSDVLWVDGGDLSPLLRRTPLEVGSVLDKHLWSERAAVLTSATLADGLIPRLGLSPDEHAIHRLGSPFDFEKLGILYCPAHLPDPRHRDHRAHVHEEIAALAEAAGGRTLALFTSYSAMKEAAEALGERLPGPILVQGDGSRQALVGRFASTDGAVLLATLSFWQGVDIPGEALTLVTIDRLPFPRPDDPVAQARRRLAGAAGFREVDLPRAQTLLAQAAGRLIRRADDRGVVAVLDSRLATNRNYRWELIRALPPLRRTRHRAEACDLLRSIDREARAGVG